MKKNNKKVKQNIVGFIIGAIIFSILGVYAATQINSKDVIYKDDITVESAINDLYNKTLYLGKIKIGDYVSMTPTLTNYEILGEETGCINGVECGDITDGSPQTINPSELNIWRIININSDGTADAVSEYVSSTNVYFSGKKGYQNYIGTLNKIAASYTNLKYVARTRHMGYNGQTNYIIDASKLDQTTASWETNTSSETTLLDEILGAGDMGYEPDYNLVKKVLGTAIANKVGTITATEYWLASRYYYYSSLTYWIFYARFVNAGGVTLSYNLYRYLNSNFYSDSFCEAIRPIITLKSGLTTNGGDGKSEATAWTFS